MKPAGMDLECAGFQVSKIDIGRNGLFLVQMHRVDVTYRHTGVRPFVINTMSPIRSRGSS
jgi:hypothetical protein